jgi:FkbM family methyltransferase
MLFAERRKKLMQARAINTILDVGANAGQFAQSIRSEGWFGGRIISFEPLRSAFSDLNAATQSDERWQALNMALGDKDCTAQINVSKNSWSSSFLPVQSWSLDVEPTIAYSATEEVPVLRFDGLVPELKLDGAKCLLKIDTQGTELSVLDGFGAWLDNVPLIQLESSFRTVYEGEPNLERVLNYMYGKGFRPVCMDHGWDDPSTGEVFQVDVLFAGGDIA